MWSTRIIDRQYEVVKPFRDDGGHFVGVCRRLKDGELVVIKASGNTEDITHECEMNELLDAKAPEVTKMLEYVPAGPGTRILRLSLGYQLTGFSYMVLPLMGPDLVDTLMQANKEGIQLSWEAKQYLCSQVVHCLHYLNVEKRLAHLDVKGENFVFNDQQGLSLIDFGMTQRIGESCSESEKMSPAYRAPEIVAGETYQPEQADIFGLGVCLFQIMFQNQPFRALNCLKDTSYQLRFVHFPETNMKFFNNFTPKISEALSQVPYQTIVKCLSRDPAHRPTIKEILLESYFQARAITEKVKGELSGLISRIE